MDQNIGLLESHVEHFMVTLPYIFPFFAICLFFVHPATPAQSDLLLDRGIDSSMLEITSDITPRAVPSAPAAKRHG